MKFLDSKGGINLVKEYFADAVPNYILQFVGFGGKTKWVLRQILRATPHVYLEKILERVKSDGEFLKQDFEVIEDSKTRIVSQLNCRYMRALVKKGKKFKCDFDIREYYCKNACLPLLSKVMADVYLTLDAELTPKGCIQTVTVDKSSFEKDSEQDKDIEEKSE